MSNGGLWGALIRTMAMRPRTTVRINGERWPNLLPEVPCGARVPWNSQPESNSCTWARSPAARGSPSLSIRGCRRRGARGNVPWRADAGRRGGVGDDLHDANRFGVGVLVGPLERKEHAGLAGLRVDLVEGRVSVCPAFAATWLDLLRGGDGRVFQHRDGCRARGAEWEQACP